MKKSSDNYNIPPRVWYYLLDWNEQNQWEAIWSWHGTRKLSDLTFHEVVGLYEHAVRTDIQTMKDQLKNNKQQ